MSELDTLQLKQLGWHFQMTLQLLLPCILCWWKFCCWHGMVCAVKSVCVRADQDMLSRIHQELNARFLQDRSLLPLGLPPVPFTLHQHQHLHHHQHVLTPGTYLPNPVAQSAPAPAGLFQPPAPEVNESWCLHACYGRGRRDVSACMPGQVHSPSGLLLTSG